ncbi:MAG: PAS domain S-box protein [Bacteroidia bacterium]
MHHKNISLNLENILPCLLVIDDDMEILWTSDTFQNQILENQQEEMQSVSMLFPKEVLCKIQQLIMLCQSQGNGIVMGIVLKDIALKPKTFNIEGNRVEHHGKILYRIEWKPAKNESIQLTEWIRLQQENQTLRHANQTLLCEKLELQQELQAQRKLIERLNTENQHLIQVNERKEGLDLIVETAQKHIAKAELVESQQRLQLALDAGQLGIWDWNIESGYVVYNQRWAEMLGYNLSEITPNVSTFFELVHPEDSAVMDDAVQRHLKGETPYFEVEIRLKGADGAYHWVYDRGMIVARDPQGTPLRAVGIHVYINDHKRATQALKESEQRFKNVFKFSPIGIILTSMKGDILEVNPKIIEILGYTLEELRDLRPIDFSHPDDLAEERIRAKEMFSQGKDFFHIEKRYIRKDKKVIWTNFSLTLVRDENNKEKLAIGLIEDITQRKEAEEQLIHQNQELLKINEELNNFVYRTSHDLRAPLTSLMGLIQIIELAKDAQEQKRYLSMMSKQLNYLDGVIREIIDYRKVSAGETFISCISIEQKIAEAIERFQFLENYDLIERSIDIQGDSDFYTDETKLNIILNNLISNSIKYADLSKTKPFLRIEARISPKEAVLHISDNGIGIPDVHLPNIFKMFFRATTQQNGTGLGLYIVKEALEKLGGGIEVESHFQVGTSFSLRIPNRKI